MALVRCSECGKEISDKAEKCPNCGYIMKRAKAKGINRVLAILMVAILLIICGTFMVVKVNPISKFFQFGSAEAKNDIKKQKLGLWRILIEQEIL